MKSIHPEKNDESEHRLYEVIAAIKTAEEAAMFFEDLCTPAEIQAMADRWRVILPIKAGKPYRQIHDETGVSVTTIGRVARCLQFGSGGYRLLHERVGKKLNENTKQIKNCGTKKRPIK